MTITSIEVSECKKGDTIKLYGATGSLTIIRFRVNAGLAIQDGWIIDGAFVTLANGYDREDAQLFRPPNGTAVKADTIRLGGILQFRADVIGKPSKLVTTPRIQRASINGHWLSSPTKKQAQLTRA